MNKVGNRVFNVNAFKSVFFSLFVLIYAVFVSFAITISPVVAALLFVPLIGLIFWLAPTVETYPKKLLMFMFFLWLAASVLWPSYLNLQLPGLPGIEPSRVLLSTLIFIWIFYLIKSTDMKNHVHSVFVTNTKYFLFFLFIFLIKFIAIFFSESIFQSLFYYIKDLIEVFLPALVLLSLFMVTKDIKEFLFVLAVIGGGVILISMVELIVNKNVFSLYLPPGFVMSSEYVEQAISEKIRGGGYRVQGPFGHPLLLAQFIVVILPIYVYLFLTHPKRLVKLISFILIPLAFIVLYKTGSRSIFIGIAAEIIIVAALYLRLVMVTKKTSVLGWITIVSYPVFILLGLFIFYLTMDYFLGQTIQEMNSTNARLLMWERGLSIITESPLFGFGSGSAAYVLGFTGGGGVLTIDSYYLSVLLESGYIGFIVFIAYFVLIFYLGVKLIKMTPQNSAILLTVMPAIFGYLTIALILSTPHNLNILFLLTVIFLLLNNEAVTKKQAV